MEIIISLLLLVVVWFVMTFYLLMTLYIVINVFMFFKAIFTTMPGRGYKKRFRDKLPLNILTFLPKKRFIQIIVAMILINIGLYAMSYNSWINDKQALHLKAKYYLLPADVLSRELQVAYLIYHPDGYKIRPAVWLLKGIYALGAKHLPDDDGEKAMWYYRFFIYPYASKDSMPYSNLAVREELRPYISPTFARIWREVPIFGVVPAHDLDVPLPYKPDKDFRKPHIKFLNKCFEILQEISTKPIKDRNMHRAYLQAYPGFAFYFSLNQIYYYNGSTNRREIYYMPFVIEQNKKQLKWYLEFERLFEDKKLKQLYRSSYYKNKVYLYLAILTMAEDFLEIEYINHTFNCNNKSVKTYVRFRNLLVGEDANKAALLFKTNFKELKKVNDSQGEKGGVLFKLKNNMLIYNLYTSYVNGDSANIGKYIGSTTCGYKVHGKNAFNTAYEYAHDEDDEKESYESFLRNTKRREQEKKQ